MLRSLTRVAQPRAVLRAVQQPAQPARVAVRAFASAPHGAASHAAADAHAHEHDPALDQPWLFGENVRNTDDADERRGGDG